VRTTVPLIVILALAQPGCDSDTPVPDVNGVIDIGLDLRGTDGSSPDAALDAQGQEGGADLSADAVPSADLDPNAPLVIEQIHLDVVMGESALVVGPDGTSVLIDVGGHGHAKAVLEAVDRRLGQRTVDWVILTHFHYDHVGNFAYLVQPNADNGNKPLTINKGVISRGHYDVGNVASGTPTFQTYCAEITKAAWSAKRVDLCTGTQQADCKGTGGPWPASGCPGLLWGDLATKTDDAKGLTSYLDLGGGARITLFHANGRLATSDGVKAAADEGINLGTGGTAPENGRSLGGVIQWGDFRYLFDGDLTSTTEAFIAKHAAKITTSKAGPLLLPAGSLDVMHLSHHGLEGSSSQGWLDWLFPAGSQDRNAVIGANGMYVIAPSGSVLNRVGQRVNNGFMWLTVPAVLGGKHAKLKTITGAVVLRVKAGGSSYEVFGRTAAGPGAASSFTSTKPAP